MHCDALTGTHWDALGRTHWMQVDGWPGWPAPHRANTHGQHTQTGTTEERATRQDDAQDRDGPI